MPPAEAYARWTRTVESSWDNMLTQPQQTSRRTCQSSTDMYGGLCGLIERYGVVNGSMAYDVQTYLNDDLLAMGDRMSMAHALELRAPFLDTTLLSFMTTLHHRYKLRGMPWQEDLKVLLKQIACNYLPHDVVYRPKQGFMAPVKHWLRADLAVEVEALLIHKPLGGLIRREFVQQQWQQHQHGHDRSDILWGLLLMDRWMAQRGWQF